MRCWCLGDLRVPLCARSRLTTRSRLKITPTRTRGERESSRIVFPVILPSRIEFAGFSGARKKIQAWFFVFHYVPKTFFLAYFFRVVESKCWSQFPTCTRSGARL